MKLSFLALAASVALSSTIAATAAFAADITGAGGTFPAPVYNAWGSDFKAKTGTALNYQAIGSGGGQTQITNRTVDFGTVQYLKPTDAFPEIKLPSTVDPFTMRTPTPFAFAMLPVTSVPMKLP